MKRPCVRVPREEGEATRSRLAEADLLDREWAIAREGDELFLPVVDPDAVPSDLDLADHEVEPRETQTLPGGLLDFEPTYERLGDLVLLDEEDPERAREAAEDAAGDGPLYVDWRGNGDGSSRFASESLGVAPDDGLLAELRGLFGPNRVHLVREQ